MEHGFERRGGQLGTLLAGAVVMAILGWWDDRKELGAGVKFAGQLLVAVAVAAAGVRITLFVHSLAFSYVVTVVWILAVTNAFNFMDNMNGLCTGLGVIAAWTFAVGAAARGQYLVAVLALMCAGSLLGFLPYNFPSARAFLGDAGSHLVGYWMAVLAILPHYHSREHPDPWAVLIPVAVLAVPLADLASVVWIRWRLGKPFWVGDNNHFSHRLVRAGLGRTRAVLWLWLAAAVVAGLSLWL